MNNKLYISNLNYKATWEEIKEFFSQYGEVEFVKLLFDRETKRPRGNGFVTFINAEDAAKALEQGNGVEFQGRAISIAYAKPREEKADGGYSNSDGGNDYQAEPGE